MAEYVKRHDPNQHLVSTTYGSLATWKCPHIDFTMRHMYGQAGNIADFTPLIASEARDAMSVEKPYLLAEFGIDWQTGDNQWDRGGTGVNMHNGIWASMMAGAAGTSMLWYWDGYVHPCNLYHVLTPSREFADTVDWAKTRFQPISSIRLEQGSEQPETFSDLTLPATVEWDATPSNEYSVLHDGSVQGGPVAMTIGSPKRGNPKELHTQLTWRLDMPCAGKVIARLGQVSTKARLRITLDNEVKLDRQLSAGEPGKGPWKSTKYFSQWKGWISDYQEDIAIEVPAGRHALTFSNTDGDWLQIRSILLPGYRSSRYPNVNAVGLQSERLLLAWFHNPESTWRTDYEGRKSARLHVASRQTARGGEWNLAGRVVGHVQGRGISAGGPEGRERQSASASARLRPRRGGEDRKGRVTLITTAPPLRFRTWCAINASSWSGSTPAPCVKKAVSRSGSLVIALRNAESAMCGVTLWANTIPPAHTKGSTFSR